MPRFDQALEKVPAHCPLALVVDTQAIGENYSLITQKIGSARCGAVVKANAYGLGLAGILPTLQELKCQDYFVAHPHEGTHLRSLLGQERNKEKTWSRIYVLAGVFPQLIESYRHHEMIPVLNDIGQIDLWAQQGRKEGKRLPAVIQLDTGLARNGLGPQDVAYIKDHPELLQPLEIQYWMTHLARSKEGPNPANPLQIDRLREMLVSLPKAPVTLASSAGVFLGSEYHFQLVRVATALFGMRPLKGQDNPMRPVVGLYGRVLQVRTCEAGESVGYGATHLCQRESRLATVGVGYADGYPRSQEIRNRHAFAGTTPVPLVGRVSMDYTVMDVTHMAPDKVVPGSWIQLAGPSLPIDDLADQMGTVAYEVLTQLRARCHRVYI
jgi:alanine racemase